uniref:Major facilitator superfamily (MFS) profile domain-containing protein n=1 Tax=Podarcis muralis TaxID=64176 RepID=A0A670KHR6_PODMU
MFLVFTHRFTSMQVMYLRKLGSPEKTFLTWTLGTGACECLTALTCGLLIESMGRRVLILGGYSLMTLWCIVLTFSLTYQVGWERQHAALASAKPSHVLSLPQVYSWAPYLSMACIFAFILSFGLGPGTSSQGSCHNCPFVLSIWLCSQIPTKPSC